MSVIANKIRLLFNSNILYVKHLSSSYSLMLVNYILFFFLTPYSLKMLGETQYGIWALLSSIIVYFNISNLGLNNTFLVELPKVKNNQEEYNKLLNTTFFTLLGVSLITLLIVFVLYFGFEYMFKIDKEYLFTAKSTLLIVYSIFSFSFICSVFDNILYSTGHIHRKNNLEIVKVLLIGITTFLILKLGYGIITIALANLVITVFYYYNVFLLSKKLHYFKINWKDFDLPLLKKMIAPSWHFFVLGMASYIVFFSDNLLISNLKGIQYVSLYSIMYRLTDVSLKTLFKISDMKYPKITILSNEKKFTELLALHNKLLLITAICSVFAFIIIFFFGKDLLTIWLGSKYDLDDRILKVFAIFVVCHSCVHVTSLFLFGTGNHARLSKIAIADSILNLILSYTLFQYFDLLGIALGTLLSHLLTGFWFVYYEFFRVKNKILTLQYNS